MFYVSAVVVAGLLVYLVFKRVLALVLVVS
jgi:hypothetical protein